MSLHPLAGGSVTALRSADSSFAGGALPTADGTFAVDGLSPGRYTIRVRLLGFAPRVISGVEVSASAHSLDLGTLRLTPVATRLSAQTITAEQAAVDLSPDRNSYTAKDMATTSGGTAVDVLRNIPAVDVSGSGVVSLNGSANVVIQINGKSSPLHGEELGNFLAQLPSRIVSRVEVATNPSAKSDPDGAAGIINIVLLANPGFRLNGGGPRPSARPGAVSPGTWRAKLVRGRSSPPRVRRGIAGWSMAAASC